VTEIHIEIEIHNCEDRIPQLRDTYRLMLGSLLQMLCFGINMLNVMFVYLMKKGFVCEIKTQSMFFNLKVCMVMSAHALEYLYRENYYGPYNTWAVSNKLYSQL
jgi:hypothetical protein